MLYLQLVLEKEEGGTYGTKNKNTMWRNSRNKSQRIPIFSDWFTGFLILEKIVI